MKELPDEMLREICLSLFEKRDVKGLSNLIRVDKNAHRVCQDILDRLRYTVNIEYYEDEIFITAGDITINEIINKLVQDEIIENGDLDEKSRGEFSNGDDSVYVLSYHLDDLNDGWTFDLGLQFVTSKGEGKSSQYGLYLSEEDPELILSSKKPKSATLITNIPVEGRHISVSLSDLEK